MSERKYYHLKTTPLTKTQKELMVGCLLGKGALLKHKRGCRFTVGHLAEEEHILLWKRSLLEDYVNVIVDHQTLPAKFFRTTIHHELNNYHKLFYYKNKKRVPDDIVGGEDLRDWVSPLSLAAWVSDVGWRMSDGKIRLETSNYRWLEHMSLGMVLERYGIDYQIGHFNRQGKHYWYLTAGEKLWDLIENDYPGELREKKPKVNKRLYI